MIFEEFGENFWMERRVTKRDKVLSLKTCLFGKISIKSF